MSGNAYLMTLIGVQLGIQGIASATIGYIMVGYSVGFVGGAFFAPKLLMRVGHIRSFAALASITAMAAITYPLIDNVWLWALLRLIGGFAVAALFVAIESWISAVSSNDNRARLLALYSIAAYSASAGGQLLIQPGLNAGSNAAYIFAALLLMASVIPLSISRLQSPPIEPSENMSLKKLWNITSLGVLTAMSAGALIGGFYSLTPLFATLIGFSTSQVGLLMSASVFSAMILAWPIGWICDRVERSRVLFVSAIVAGVAALLVTISSELPFTLVAILLSIFMALIASIYSIAVALTNDLVDPSERVPASSALMLSYGIGSIIGPLSGAWLMEFIGTPMLFAGFASTLFGLAIFTLYRRNQQTPIPVEDQEQFVVTVPEAQVVTELDPRSEEQEEIPIEELFPEEMSQSAEDDIQRPEDELNEHHQEIDSKAGSYRDLDRDIEEENHRVV